MRKFNRIDAPDFLNIKWEKWGEKYKENRIKNPSFIFQWPTFEGKRINTVLEPLLAKQTDDHCSYCDFYPERNKEFSIDHFKPKSKEEFYEIVCQWENLYLCCHSCQQRKGEQYKENLLRPDAEDYTFNRYFIYSYNSHRINPNPALTENDKLKAETTITVFGFNEEGNIAARRINLDRYESNKKCNKDIVINDFAFRFTIE